jgi:hypothetical protein
MKSSPVMRMFSGFHVAVRYAAFVLRQGPRRLADDRHGARRRQWRSGSTSLRRSVPSIIRMSTYSSRQSRQSWIGTTCGS